MRALPYLTLFIDLPNKPSGRVGLDCEKPTTLRAKVRGVNLGGQSKPITSLALKNRAWAMPEPVDLVNRPAR